MPPQPRPRSIAVQDRGYPPREVEVFAHYLAMAIDAQDVPFVVFRDPSQGLRLTLMRYAPSPYTYCSAVVSSLGCTPQIAASGTPSMTSPLPFVVGATQVISQRLNREPED